MFDPDVEARFKRIEDAHLVTAELLHRFELRTQERFGRLEAIQDAMAQWMERMAARQEDLAARQEDTGAKLNALVDAQLRSEAAIAELSRTVDRFLKSRSNGGGA